MKSIQIAFYIAKHGTILDKLIAFLSSGKYSHAELVFPDGDCFSASCRDKGTRFKKIDFHPDRWDFITINVCNPEFDKLKDFCLKELGKKYDYLGALGIILPLKQSNNKWFCSEIVVSSLQSINLFVGLKASSVSPNKLHKISLDLFISKNTSARH